MKTKSTGSSRVTDIEDNGTYLLMEQITYDSVSKVIRWILSENINEQKRDELKLIICSPGGSTSACFALIDVILGSRIPISTVGIGVVASAGFLIFISGEKGRRILTPNSLVLSHQFRGGRSGKEHDLIASRKKTDLLSENILRHYKNRTKLSKNKIKKYLLPPQDVWLSAKEALNLGICDEIREMGKYKKAKKKK